MSQIILGFLHLVGIRRECYFTGITDVSNIKSIAKDLAAVGEIRARILTNPKINSLNFTIDVVNGIAYLSGISSNEEEINLVTNIAKQARFVTEVYNYIKINSEKR